MAQHLLLSAQARTLSLKAIYQAGDDEAYDTFCKLAGRRPMESPQCPRCEGAKAYSLSTRRKFKCVACHHQFSVTRARSSLAGSSPSSICWLPSVCS